MIKFLNIPCLLLNLLLKVQTFIKDQPAARVQMFHPRDVSTGKPEVSCIQHVPLGTFKQEPVCRHTHFESVWHLWGLFDDWSPFMPKSALLQVKWNVNRLQWNMRGRSSAGHRQKYYILFRVVNFFKWLHLHNRAGTVACRKQRDHDIFFLSDKKG